VTQILIVTKILIVIGVLIGRSFHLADQMRFQRGHDSSVSIGQKTTNRTTWKVISFFTSGRTFDWPEF
jgi:hypothetical protein